MQLGDPQVLETSSGEAVAPHEGFNGGAKVVGADANSSEDKGIREGGGGGGDEGDKLNCGGNRWPRQETLALLKIRSDMDAVFRDSSLKGPLWEEVSRKLAELGYHRSAKKCKEKFENVYKYHKRTKESRNGKAEGKTYRFFDQLQALENQFTISCYPPNPKPTTNDINSTVALPTRPSDTTTSISYVTTTVPSTNPTVISPSPPTNATTTIPCTTTQATNPRNTASQATNNNNNVNVPYSLPSMNFISTTTTTATTAITSTSSSTASDEDLEEKYRKKRKWKDYFRRLTRQVLAKQEEMQKKFLEAIDKREREQVAQQDAWRMQEMARINREHELLVQERSTAAAKDAAVIAFLQKLSGQQNPTITTTPQQQPPLPPPPAAAAVVSLQPQQLPPLMGNNNSLEIQKVNNGYGHHHGSGGSSSRWPKSEVHALIRLRTSLETKYQENGPKAPLWEAISAGMQRLGYNRSSKRCKEKWENINKYFKKVKESKKQRREDSKTCPYFHELDALYKEKTKNQHNPFGASFQNMKPNEMMEPLMVQPEQQWRPPPQYEQHEMKENENEEAKGREAQEEEEELEEEELEELEEEEEEEDNDNDEDIEFDGDSVEDERGSRYEIATNKLSSVDTVE